jgi:hypothetical protein
MEITHTSRGFELIHFMDRYGLECTLQQSSAADCELPGSSAIWLGAGEERMHISREQLKELMRHLWAWVETGSFCLSNRSSLKEEDKAGAITFEEFVSNTFVSSPGIKDGVITLHPWQKEAAAAFLKVVRKHQSPRMGKTLLVKLMLEFINEHGNNFDL